MRNGQECAIAVYSFYASHNTFQDFLKFPQKGFISTGPAHNSTPSTQSRNHPAAHEFSCAMLEEFHKSCVQLCHHLFHTLCNNNTFFFN